MMAEISVSIGDNQFQFWNLDFGRNTDEGILMSVVALKNSNKPENCSSESSPL